MNLQQKLRHYFGTTYRRKSVDTFLNNNSHLFKGVVLDIGGRDRGAFKKPKLSVEKWIFADIVADHQPDIVLDVSNMKETISTNTIETILAAELFEHVAEIELALKECFRVLKKGGRLIVTVPFLFPVHADPNDYQRWTAQKWHKELEKTGFLIEKIEVSGYFMKIFADLSLTFWRQLPRPLSYIKYPLMPFYSLLTLFDTWSGKTKQLSKYHQGYFIVAKKR